MMPRRTNAALPMPSALLVLALALLLGDTPTAAADEGCVKTGTSCLWKEYADAVAASSTKNSTPSAPLGRGPVVPECQPGWNKPSSKLTGEGISEFWPDCNNLEEDIDTTCAGMKRDHCPYDAEHAESSILCEWMAKGAVNWWMRSEFEKAPEIAGSMLRTTFHDSGQFMYQETMDGGKGEYGTGDDGSIYYEANPATTRRFTFFANPSLWETILSLRKVYRKVNTCGASPEAACRTPCETICDYEDADTVFSGFMSDGTMNPTCDVGDTARVMETSRPEPRSSSSSADADEDDADVYAKAVRARAATTAASRPSSSRARPAGRGLLSASASRANNTEADADDDEVSAPRPAATTEASRGWKNGHDDTHDGKHEYKHGGNYDHAHPIYTPFAQDKKWGSGKKCYSKCKDTCVDYYDDTQLAKEPGYSHVGAKEPGTTGGVQCKVAYADHVQYGGAAAVEVTGGPKLLRYIKGGRCDAPEPDQVSILPVPAGQGVKDMTNLKELPFYSPCHCGGNRDLVALMGSHTIGHAHGRLVGKTCQYAIAGNTEDARFMDPTPRTFDNEYWKGVARARCPKKRVSADDYNKCTTPYLTSDWTDSEKSWTEMDDPEKTVDSVWFEKRNGKETRCTEASEDNANPNFSTTCSVGACTRQGKECDTFEESTGCTCDVCGLKDAAHCSGYATCGEFHSDNMLYGTAETAVFVEEYARDESAFFRDYQAAHIRMAHVGCEACGPESHLATERCPAGYEDKDADYKKKKGHYRG